MQDIFIGLAILAVLGIIAYLATHHKAVQTPAGADLANVLASASSDAWDAVKRDLPSIVSAEVSSLRNALSDMETRAIQAEAKFAAEVQASGARLEAVKAEVVGVVSKIGALPASAVPVAAVAAVEAQDAARVVAFADQINPNRSTLNSSDLNASPILDQGPNLNAPTQPAS